MQIFDFRFMDIIRGTRKIVGVIIIIGAFFIAIPGFTFLVLSDAMYGSPIFTEEKILIPTVGQSTTIDINNQMKSGNNYDIKVMIRVSADKNNPPTGAIAIQMTAVSTGITIPSDVYSKTGFNSTNMYETYEFPSSFSSDAVTSLTFTVDSQTDILSIYVKVELYENPSRRIAGTLAIIGILLLIPALCCCCIGICIAGTSEKK